MNHSETVNFIWNIANLIRDDFRRSKYPDVILPFTVLRRIDCVLADSKENVLAAYTRFKGQISDEALDKQLRRASGFAFYNTSQYDFERLHQDADAVADNLLNYINGFSPNMREVIEKFDFYNTLSKLNDAGILYLVLQEFKQIDLHPNRVNNTQMGTIFEELIRKFNEASNENPGEHFTPPDVVTLMVDLLMADDSDFINTPHRTVTVYDPCCGTGGMLTKAKERILSQNSSAHVHLFGQEVNPETYAVCKSDLYMKSEDGRDADNIAFGSTLSNDQHSSHRFNYVLANPPYGKDWRKDKADVESEAARQGSRFSPGLPRSSDGQMLFLLHMIARMHEKPDDATTPAPHARMAVIMNGSPLFTGDAGSGESQIRRYVLEHDLLEAIIALPESLFYNTGIGTYVWVLSTDKAARRKDKVQLIDATSYWVSMRKSLGDKRREISDAQIGQITALYRDFAASEHCQIFERSAFGYRKIQVERPLRLNFAISEERLARLPEQSAFTNLAKSRKRNPEQKAAEEAAGRQQQQAILTMLRRLNDDLFAATDSPVGAHPRGRPDSYPHGRPDTHLRHDPGQTHGSAPTGRLYKNRKTFMGQVNAAAKASGIKLTAALRKAIWQGLGEKDESADSCLDSKGNPEADTDLRDYERVPLGEDVNDFLAREVTPYVPDAWINDSYRDDADQQVGKVGYEINFNRYFYEYTPPRPLAEIEEEIKTREQRIVELLAQVTGNGKPGL